MASAPPKSIALNDTAATKLTLSKLPLDRRLRRASASVDVSSEHHYGFIAFPTQSTYFPSSVSSSGNNNESLSPPTRNGSHTTIATSISAGNFEESNYPSSHEDEPETPDTASSSGSAVSEQSFVSIKNGIETTSRKLKKLGNFLRGGGGAQKRVGDITITFKRTAKTKPPKENSAASVPIEKSQETINPSLANTKPLEPAEPAPVYWRRKQKHKSDQPQYYPSDKLHIRDEQSYYSLRYITDGPWSQYYAKTSTEAKQSEQEQEQGKENKHRSPVILANHRGNKCDELQEFRRKTNEEWQEINPTRPFLPLDPELGRVSMPVRYGLSKHENPYRPESIRLRKSDIIMNNGDFTFI